MTDSIRPSLDAIQARADAAPLLPAAQIIGIDTPRLVAALRAVLGVLDRHEQDNPLGREQWNADIRTAIDAHINITPKETP